MVSDLTIHASTPPTRLYTWIYLARKYTGLLVRLPLWGLWYIPRSNRPRRSWSWGRAIIARIAHYTWEIPLRTGRWLDRDVTEEVPPEACMGTKFIWIDPVPGSLIQGNIQGYAERAGVEPIRIPSYGFGEWGQGAPCPAREGEKVVMYCHGGAYVILSAHPETVLIGIPKGLVQYGKQTISRLLSIEYRLSRSAPWAPSSPFPTALIDALSGYNYLIQGLGFKSENIILCGDSAGGNLVLALTRYLRDNPQVGLGLPGGLLLISPWCDLVGTHMGKPSDDPNCNSAKNHETMSDYLSGDFDSPHSVVQYGFRSLLGNISPEESRKMAYINPASLDLDEDFVTTMFDKFPSTYIVYGGAEVLVDEIRTLHKRMAKCLGAERVVKDEVPDAIHDFVGLEVWEPERTEAHKRIAAWLASLK